jgi:putative hydrolase of HD superfamily
MHNTEARFVKDLDKFDMILQAYEYEQDEHRAGGLESFFASTRGKFTTPQVQAWVAELEARRKPMS